MKIDIITLHYIWHYGSLLQTYATCKVFEKLGLETEVIDYVRPNASETEEIKAGRDIQFAPANMKKNLLKKHYL